MSRFQMTKRTPLQKQNSTRIPAPASSGPKLSALSARFYITTAIDYPNANPHMGHAYEKIVADSYARWMRLKGAKVHFLTGLDEHGQKLQIAAAEERLAPQDFVDEKAIVFKDFCRKLAISYDEFIRTTQSRHVKVAQELFKQVFSQGEIYKGHYEGHYCVPCETYWTQKDLIDGNCAECKRPTQSLKEESYFFKMSKYQERIIKHIETHPEFIFPESRRKEILARLKKEPLRDLSVSRTSFEWGIPTPIDPTHVIYVWFDALINYVSAVKKTPQQFKAFWPADVHVIGKDILWFHTVIWPAILYSAGMELPRTVYVHGFINDENGEKMSKSKGNVVDPMAIVDKHGADALRYYFLRSVPSGQDGNFSEKELVARYNGELADTFGNLLSRVTKLIESSCDGTLHNDGYADEIDVSAAMRQAEELMRAHHHNRALDIIWAELHRLNAYVNAQQPWKIKGHQERNRVLYNVAENLRILSIALSAFIPDSVTVLFMQLGVDAAKQNFAAAEFGKGLFNIKKDRAPLFPKIEYTEKPRLPLDLRIAKIEEVKDHPNAEKLYVLQVNLGREKRQLVAGLKQWYAKERLLGKHLVVLCNLKPAALRGVESNGMLLAADDENTVAVLEAADSNPGDRVFVEGYDTHGPFSTIDLGAFRKITLKVNHENHITCTEYSNARLKTHRGEYVKVQHVRAGARVR
ncbi:methionine--tRNA ligase [Candidatus Woesearchaeota archaeon]|nr:methionine--tRNA ligase [Candidatus Woesearchaeota archaeon]